MKLLLPALIFYVTTNVVLIPGTASPLPTVSNEPYTSFAKPPRSGKAAPHYSISLIRGAKPELTTGTMIMHVAGHGTFPALIQRPLVRRWNS